MANAATEPTVIIRIRTISEAKSLTELRQEIRATNKELESAKPFSPEFTAATAKLAQLTAAYQKQKAAIAEATDFQKAQIARQMAEIAKIDAAVSAMGNPWITASRTAVAAMKQQQEEAAKLSQATLASAAAMGNTWTTASRTMVVELNRQKAAASAQSQAILASAAAMGNPWVSASRGLVQGSKDVVPALNSVDEAAKKNQRSSLNAGQAALQWSRGLQDFAAAGVMGIVNNIELMTMTVGGGAGLAAGLTLAAVSADFLFRNLGSLQKQAEKMDWAKMSPDEQAENRTKLFNDALEKQKRFIDGLTTAWEAKAAANSRAIDQEKEWVKHQEEMRKLTNAPGDPQDTLAGYDDRTTERRHRVEAADLAATGKMVEADRAEETAAQAEVRARQQEQRVKDLERRAAAEIEEKAASEDLDAKRTNLTRIEMEAQGMLPAELRKGLNDEIKEAEKNLSRVRGNLAELPTLDVPQDADAEAKAEAMKRERARAAELRGTAILTRDDAGGARRSANVAGEALAALRERTAWEQERDERATEVKAAAEAGLPEPLPRLPGTPSVLLDPATRPLLTRAPEPAPETPPDDGEQNAGNEAVTKAAGEIDQLIGEAQNAGFKAKLQELRATLTDADGATEGDLMAIKNFLESVKTRDSEAKQLILQIARDLAEAMRAMNSGLEAVRVDVAELRTQTRE